MKLTIKYLPVKRSKGLNKIYLAYGSNLNHDQMTERCPNSKFIGASFLEGWTLLFKGAATIRENEKSVVPVGLFEITQECEDSLDVFEDFPRLYDKKVVEIEFNGRKLKAMTYVMCADYGTGPPSGKYYNVIYKGYIDCNLNTQYLEEAKNYAKNNDSGNSFISLRWRGDQS